MSYDLSKWEIYKTEKTGHPIEKHTLVNILVHIRHVPTGEVRMYRDWTIYDPNDGDTPSDFMYSDGNYACDCNRHLFFHRANGVEPEDNRPCGHALYEVNLANAKDGEVYYREFDIPADRRNENA